MTPISVITCTHNPRANYLAEVIEALRSQTFPLSQWEYLLIDNASSAERKPVVDLSWHQQARFLREEKLGLTAARLRGIREAEGELLIFVDDDNVLDPDFLEQVLKIADEKPFLGSWSGQCRPRFEVTPPEWTRRYWGNLVIREFNTDVWSNLSRLAETMPCGAGLCVRRDVALHCLALHENNGNLLQFDRTGDSLLSGGDNHLAACACDLGMGIGLISALKLTHLIPPERLTLPYLKRLVEGIEFSSVLLDAEYGILPPDQNLVSRLADRLRLLRPSGPHRSILQAVYAGRAKALDRLHYKGLASNDATRSHVGDC